VLEQQSCEEGPPRDLLMGLFGTTAFYEHVTSTQMLPLEKCARLTRVLRGMRVSRTNQPASLRLFRSLCIVSIPLLRSEKTDGLPSSELRFLDRSHLDSTAVSLYVSLCHVLSQPLGAGQTMLSSSEVLFAHSFRVSESCCCSRP
jgi:hypothetical protein